MSARASSRYEVCNECKVICMRAIFSLCLILIGTASAGEPAVVLDPVFECYRVNTAWGFAMSGSAIGRDGVIVRYSLRDMALRPTPQKEGGVTYYDSSNLRAHFVGATTSNKIDPDQLRNNLALVDDAVKGNISASLTGVRDAGVSTCHAYIPDAGANRYRDVELGSDGAVSDMRVENDSKAAATLRDWLISVGVATK
jgi:hypothetical protein